MEKLTRTAYRDPADDTERDGSTARRESLVDYENHHRPLERVHASAMHAPGVAAGLEVRATRNAPGLRVQTGVAVSAAGDHISLIPGGQAKIATTVVPVTADGAAVATTGLSGAYELTIAWAETFDRRTFEDSGRKTFQTDHTPALRLRPAADPGDAAAEIVLAAVTLAAGAVTALDPGTRAHCTTQLTVTTALGSVTGDDLAVRAVRAGLVRPAPAGGLMITAASLTVGAAAGAAALSLSGAGNLDVAAGLSLGGRSAVSAVGGRLRLNDGGGFTEGVQVTGALSVGAASAGDLAVGRAVRVGRSVAPETVASLVIDDDTAGDTAAFRRTSLGPNWSLVHHGPTGDWIVRSAATTGKVVLQDAGGRVGIGTADPKALLDVSGGAIMAAAGPGDDAGIRFQDRAHLRYAPSQFDEAQLRIGVADEGDAIVFERAGVAQLAVRSSEVFVSGLLAVDELAAGEADLGTARVNALTATGEVRLGRDGPVLLDGNRNGPFLKLHDDLWFSDPQDGSVMIRNGDDSGFGLMIGLFNAPCSARFKEHIDVLDEPALAALHDDALRTPVATFRYRGAGPQARRRLGVIAERCPPYLVDGDGVNPVEYAAMLHAAVQVLASQVAALAQRAAPIPTEESP